MGHRSHIGGALLSAAALAWITAASVLGLSSSQHVGSLIVVILFVAGGVCLAGALYAFEAHKGIGTWMRRRNQIALRSPIMRKGSLTHQAHVETCKGIDYRFGIELGRLAERADPAGEYARKREAERLLIESADLGNAAASFELATLALERGDRKMAKERLRIAADLGHAEAKLELSRLLRESDG